MPARRLRLAALLVLVALAAAACQVRLTTDIRVEDDGSGVVRAGIGLDDEALAELGDPAARLRTDDLLEAGWTVEGPTREADGLTWVRVAKPFATPAEGNRVLAQLSSAEGPLQGLRMAQSESLWRRTTTFEGDLDLSSGLVGLVDAGLVESFGSDLGLGLEALQDRFGPSLGEVVQMEVTVQLPGSPAEIASARVGDEPRSLDAEVRRWNAGVALPAIASLVLAALALLLVWRGRHGRTRPASPAGAYRR